MLTTSLTVHIVTNMCFRTQIKELQEKLITFAPSDTEHLQDVHARLGYESFQRIALETAITGDAQAWRSTAPPVLGVRGLFQKNYTEKGYVPFDLRQKEPAEIFAEVIPYSPAKWADSMLMDAL